MPEFEVTDLPPADHPEPGDEAPEFTRPLVNDEYWEDRSLSDLTADGRVVLVFTPMVGSFVAQYVWDEVVERGWDDRGATVVGVSISTPYDLIGYLREREYPFEQFSDPANDVAAAYGVVHDLDGMVGVREPRPAVFVIDGDRTVEHTWVAAEWPDFPDYEALEAALED